MNDAEEVIRRQGERLGYRSFTTYPIIYRDQVVAALILFYDHPRVELSTEEVHVASRLAFMIGATEENSRLYQSEHRIAETLQEAMMVLPDRLPRIEFAQAYRSATESARVGGDFYDIFEIGPDRIGIVVGDISGKGLEAAVLTSRVKNTIRAYTLEDGKGPAEIISLANAAFYRSTTPEQFATVFFGILDTRDGRLVYTNAGHTTGAVAADGTIRGLPSTGPLLGALPEPAFDEEALDLGIDELLFLYTDGLTEARRGSEQFGEQRLMDILGRTDGAGPADVIRRVIDSVQEFSGSGQRDDVAVLAVRRVPD